ncbi:MAG TPA: hypothetical protein VFJ52_06290, partial [Terriglobia bacterium]|nr:hypothetical protein [Terriglobia bacterium]
MAFLVVLPVALIATQPVQRAAAEVSPATNQKIIQYVREKFGIPNNVKLTVAPFQNSEYVDFYKTEISLDNGKQKKSQPALITKDG